MIFHPTILALLMASALISTTLVCGAAFGSRILARWNPTSGSAAQLTLERQTYLVSTLLGFALIAQLLALLLFIFNADRMASTFIGAMCAVGSLRVNGYGMPALIAQIVAFFAAAQWLVVNHVDNLGHDYPLIRVKYAGLLALAPLVLIAGGLQLAYFLNLRADVITSCCGKLFTRDSDGVMAEMASLDETAALWLLFGAAGTMVLLGGWIRRRLARSRDAGVGAWIYSLGSAGAFVLAITGIVSVLSLYVYENPNHHCPFCLLKPEYRYVGYALYIPLFAATATGLAVGPVGWARRYRSLIVESPKFTHWLVGVSMAGFAIFGVVAAVIVLQSGLVLFP